MKNIVIGIDQSYTCTAVVVIANGVMLEAQMIKSPKAMDIFERAWMITTSIVAIISKYDPKSIVLEGLAYGGKGNATRDLAGLQFTIVTYLRFIHNHDVKIVAPGTVKKLATGKGNSDKKLLLEHLPQNVRNQFDKMNAKKTTGLMDLTDAYWIARTGETLL